MIYPIYVYGMPVLRKVSEDIAEDYEGLEQLIEDMYQTMYQADGVGLAANQIGLPIRLIVIDGSRIESDEEGDPNELKDFKMVLINARIIEESGEPWEFNEGCLSIPAIREDVKRKPEILLQYQDENFETHTSSKTLAYMTSRHQDLQKTARQLLSPYLNSKRKIRLIGVRVSSFVKGEKQKTLV